MRLSSTSSVNNNMFGFVCSATSKAKWELEAWLPVLAPSMSRRK